MHAANSPRVFGPYPPGRGRARARGRERAALFSNCSMYGDCISDLCGVDVPNRTCCWDREPFRVPPLLSSCHLPLILPLAPPLLQIDSDRPRPLVVCSGVHVLELPEPERQWLPLCPGESSVGERALVGEVGAIVTAGAFPSVPSAYRPGSWVDSSRCARSSSSRGSLLLAGADVASARRKEERARRRKRPQCCCGYRISFWEGRVMRRLFLPRAACHGKTEERRRRRRRRRRSCCWWSVPPPPPPPLQTVLRKPKALSALGGGRAGLREISLYFLLSVVCGARPTHQSQDKRTKRKAVDGNPATKTSHCGIHRAHGPLLAVVYALPPLLCICYPSFADPPIHSLLCIYICIEFILFSFFLTMDWGKCQTLRKVWPRPTRHFRPGSKCTARTD